MWTWSTRTRAAKTRRRKLSALDRLSNASPILRCHMSHTISVPLHRTTDAVHHGDYPGRVFTQWVIGPIALIQRLGRNSLEAGICQSPGAFCPSSATMGGSDGTRRMTAGRAGAEHQGTPDAQTLDQPAQESRSEDDAGAHRPQPIDRLLARIVQRASVRCCSGAARRGQGAHRASGSSGAVTGRLPTTRAHEAGASAALQGPVQRGRR